PAGDQLPPRPLPTGADSSRSTTPPCHLLPRANSGSDQPRDDQGPGNTEPRHTEPRIPRLGPTSSAVPSVDLVEGRRPPFPGPAERAGQGRNGVHCARLMDPVRTPATLCGVGMGRAGIEPATLGLRVP